MQRNTGKNVKTVAECTQSGQQEIENFTVKAGDWEETFTCSFLRRSPFFDCMFRNEFRETKTGKVEIHLGTPETVRMALMSLGKQNPRLTMENIDNLIALSEFFLIPDLKTYCTQWLREQPVIKDNWFKLLQLATKYDITLPNCQEYVDGHLTELLQEGEFLNIDSESVEYILTERKFLYVSTETKLLFLLRWTDHDYAKRNQAAQEMETCIDFQDVSLPVLKELRKTKTFRKLFRKISLHLKHDVLLMETSTNSLWRLDLTNGRMFQMIDLIRNQQGLFCFSQILGVNKLMSQIYFTKEKTRVQTINRLDLKTSSVLPIVVHGSEEFTINPKLMSIADDLVLTVKHFQNTEAKSLIRRRLKSMSKCLPSEKLRCLAHLPKTNQTTEVYIGHIDNDSIELRPLFVFCLENIHEVCLNGESCVFIPETRHKIIIYALGCHRLDTITVQTYKDDIVSPARDGFVVTNMKRCLYVINIKTEKAEARNNVIVLDFKLMAPNNNICFFCNDYWFRHCKSRLEWIHHQKVLEAKRAEDLIWTSTKIPRAANHSTFLKPVVVLKQQSQISLRSKWIRHFSFGFVHRAK